jgi:hypothetical protein
VRHLGEHIAVDDLDPVVRAAMALPGFAEDQPGQTIMVGFAREAVLGVAETVVDAVRSGAIKHFFLIGGCDGAAPGRNYFSDVAALAPADMVLLTLGCGKYRINGREYGDIGGIPRLLDVGQCNDAYSAIKIASALADAFGCGVNDLPLTLHVSWFEQKAVAVLLTLLALGMRKIHLGPTLPAFLTPALADVLVARFGLQVGTDGALPRRGGQVVDGGVLLCRTVAHGPLTVDLPYDRVVVSAGCRPGNRLTDPHAVEVDDFPVGPGHTDLDTVSVEHGARAAHEPDPLACLVEKRLPSGDSSRPAVRAANRPPIGDPHHFSSSVRSHHTFVGVEGLDHRPMPQRRWAIGHYPA